MKSTHIRKGDTVQVMKGKESRSKDSSHGKRGKVLKVDNRGDRLVVEGVNRTRKHVKPSKTNPQGGVVDWELPINVSNVMLVCPACDRPTRVGRVRRGDKSFVRVCKRCDKEI